MTFDTDLGGIDKRHGSQHLDAVVNAVGIIFIIPPAIDWNIARIPVTEHINIKDNIASAR